MQCHEFHQRIFARGEFHRFPLEKNVARGGVNFHLADFDDTGGFIGAAADDGAKTGEQLFKVERFDDVIIRTGVQPAHAVAHLVARGEHQHRRFFGFAETLEDFPAVQSRQHHVQHNGVVVRAFGAEKTVVTGGGGVHGITFLAQCLCQAGEQIRFIFNNENSHVCRAGEILTRAFPAVTLAVGTLS